MELTDPPTNIKTGTITTGDGISLTYTQQGPDAGKPLLFIHGWRQSAAQWKRQVVRLAADLNDLLVKLDLRGLTIVSHSMGCCVTWAFWDLYPDTHKLIRKLVLVDEPAMLVADPNWPEGKAKELATIFTPDAVFNTAYNMTAGTPPLIRSMFSSSFPDEEYNWVMEQNWKISDKNAALLLTDHAFNDWSDVLPRINVPTLVVAGEISILPAAGVEWVASQIPGAKCCTFSAAEKGSHFMFWENAEKFNPLIEAFIME
ncbi:hypothetical protein ACLX1H_008010 [Fusarium chlamydosporum]